MSSTRKENLLFSQPWIYECIYPETRDDVLEACKRLFSLYMPGTSLRVLEVGCGTGRTLVELMNLDHSAKGIDISKPMVEYCTLLHPDLEVACGDMRTFALDEKFDVILCGGSTFTYNLNNEDIHRTLDNFRRHCNDGGVLVLGMLNASRFLGSETFNELVETRVDEGDFHATAFSRHLLDRRKQSFRRVRTWKIDGQRNPVIDDAEFRLFFPLELNDYLTQHGFSLLGIWDNKELKDSDLSDRRLYIAARAGQ